MQPFEIQSFESLEIEFSQIEDNFRHPNLLIQTIIEMQSKEEESLKDIKLKLNWLGYLCLCSNFVIVNRQR
jgi:hypothetical protein